MQGADHEERLRACRLLARGPATLAPAARAGLFTLDGGEAGVVAVHAGTIGALRSAGVLVEDAGSVRLTDVGAAHLRRADASGDGFAEQHREIVREERQAETGRETVSINLAELPLANLARRRDRDGRPFLAEPEVRAGERLRADFSRGQLMPRLSANWVASVSSGRRDGGTAEITEAALSARMRVEEALVAVGPELSGVLIDVCCFLKGLELVEMERNWPVRSAKIMLKTALGSLARHYEPPRRVEHGGQGIMHWGALDYRPSLQQPG